MSTQRVNIGKQHPAAYKALIALSAEVDRSPADVERDRQSQDRYARNQADQYRNAQARAAQDRVMAFLETERLRLRDIDAGDVDELFALNDDPDVMRFINGGRPASRDAVERRTLPAMMRSHSSGV